MNRRRKRKIKRKNETYSFNIKVAIVRTAEGVKVKPAASQWPAFIVLVIGAAEHGGMAAAVIVLVEIQIDLLKLFAFIEIGEAERAFYQLLLNTGAVSTAYRIERIVIVVHN